MSRPGAEDGDGPAQDPVQLVAQGVLELDHRGEGLPDHGEVDAVALGLLAGGLLDGGDDRVEGGLVGGPESSQPRTREGMALTPLGSTAIFPKVATAPARAAS